MPWQPGETGNPKGRPPKGTATADALRANIKTAEIISTVQELALSGDMTACRILLDRVLPPLRPVDAPIQLPMPGDPAAGVLTVLGALSAGSISTSQAADLAGVLTALVRVRESTELEQRIAALEQKR